MTLSNSFCLWHSLESTQLTAVYMIQCQSCCEMFVFMWASYLEEILLRVVLLRLLGRGSVGFLLHSLQTVRVIIFFPSVWRIICGGVAYSFSSASLNHNLEQAVPCLIHSAGLAEVFRYHPSAVFVHCITGLKKLFSSF